MSAATLASSGDIVLADDERVYVADGFGIGTHPEYRVSAFDAMTGELVWQRDDLTTAGSVDDVFLQALIGNTLIVNGQYDSVTAVESSTGDTIWSFRLPEGYGAVRSAAVDDLLVVGTEAPREGDIRPPIVYALDLADGSLFWETSLAEGTDLQWSAPPVAEEMVFFSSTLSHPESASGNMIHALDVITGDLRWFADLGGDQGFHFYPTLISGGLVVSMSEGGSAVALRVDDGSAAWVQPNAIPMAVGPDGTIFAYAAQGVVALDPADGSATPIVNTLAMNVNGIVIHNNQIIVTGLSGAVGIRLPDAQEAWRIHAPESVAPAAVTSNLLVIAFDSGVAVFDLPE
jgi:outer membrane protein assembly factor BamB